MRIPTLKNAIITASLALAVLGMVGPVPVSAHVVVRPAEVLTASFQTFTVSVPNEKEQANTSIKLLVPADLKHVSPTIKPGWNIAVEKEGGGEAAKVTSITWSEGTIPAGFRDDFTFSAQSPANPQELQWHAYQTYADGQVVAWDLTEGKQPKKKDGSLDFSVSGPFSVTAVVAKADSPKGNKTSDNSKAQQGANRALSMAATALVLSLVAIFIATRKNT